MSIHRATTLTRALPFGDFPFDHLFGGRVPNTGLGREHDPITQISEADHGFSLTVELPGVREEELEVQVQTDRAVVRVRSASEDMEPKHRFHGYQRAYRFRTPLNTDGATATIQHGILTLDLPKAASAVPRTLTLSTGS